MIVKCGKLFAFYGSFTLAKIVFETVSDSNTQLSLLHLPWQPWVARHRWDLTCFNMNAAITRSFLALIIEMGWA
jgi:hypothetical protein